MNPAIDSNSETLRAAVALREVRRGRGLRSSIALRCAASRQVQAVFDSRLGRVSARSTLEDLVESLAAGNNEFDELKAPSGHWPRLSARLHDESLDRLCWLFGDHLAHHWGLAPWIDVEKTYRLLSWPDFDEIGDDADGVLLCATLARQHLRVSQMGAAARLPREKVYSLVNSLSLCDSLASGPARRAERDDASTRSAGARRPESIFGSLWGRLKAL